MIRIAVVADPHVHDCDWVPSGSGLAGAIRSYGETVASTRVFNESLPAFRAALSRAVEEGAKLVLLVGDLTDDGQAPNIAAALALIAEFRAKHGLRVLAVPGNHDFHALAGRPQFKGFLTDDGDLCRIDSADCPEAATLGAELALRRMQSLGYLPDPQDLHWETPFGQDPDWSARQYDLSSPDALTRCRMIDASYLVEPVAGLWVLALDANVCVPRNGATDLADPKAFEDAGKGGWAAVLDHRAHLLGWIADVARRARAGGKQLVAFSHYPPLDVLAGAGLEELLVLEQSGLARRTAPAHVARVFAETGVGLHFSGHLHVNDTALHREAGAGFCNIAVPSPVGFCPAMKIVDLERGKIRLRTPLLDKVPGHDRAFAAYRAEAARLGQSAPFASLAPDHAAFLDRHLVELVHGRYLSREWPQDMADFIGWARMADLLAILGLEADLPDLPLTLLVEDWYRLRKGGGLALSHIARERIACYRRLCAMLPGPFPGASEAPEPMPARFIRVLRILGRYLDRLPNVDFTLDMAELTVSGR
ncbi:metallophosphoesterase (plasmid) [Paracoccus denitrificans]|uniref:metallophosphoesterase family protein n=1 Tax=Paracoccus denitrificans TaxID=266 RepID=UPI001E3456FF|nr:metallophosphoesterase [Paracoccus denitrificans]UFS68217.1 metallophosphoesterase [Paracoccus denitrificans]